MTINSSNNNNSSLTVMSGDLIHVLMVVEKNLDWIHASSERHATCVMQRCGFIRVHFRLFICLFIHICCSFTVNVVLLHCPCVVYY
jgi:hypothetical protein